MILATKSTDVFMHTCHGMHTSWRDYNCNMYNRTIVTCTIVGGGSPARYLVTNCTIVSGYNFTRAPGYNCTSTSVQIVS